MKLTSASLAELTPGVLVPGYDRSRLSRSIVHIGVGGFHRAHQAVYFDDLCNSGNLDWGLCGTGLLPHDQRMRDALVSQDCLYTVAERGAGGASARVIGSMTGYVFAPESPHALLDAMTAPATRIVSLTITEGGYCCDRESGEVDLAHPDIVHDLANPDSPRGAFGYLLAALDKRRRSGQPPFTVMSCDNVEHNGAVTRKVLLAVAGMRDAGLRAWIERNGAFPSSMVDRITPVTTDEARAQLARQFGIDDAWPVVTEPFRQWVLEDAFCDGRPPLEDVGVLMTTDVQPYELMKIRLLNASHSAMAYFGALLGFEYVHEAMADRQLRGFIEGFMDEEVTPLLRPVPGVDLAEYKAMLIKRFANPTINDQTARLCMDGSAKLPGFVLSSLREQLARDGPIDRLSFVIASWCRYLAGTDEQGNAVQVVDPMSARLTRAADQGPDELLSIEEVFGTDLPQTPRFTETVKRAYRSLEERGVRATLATASV